MISGSLVADAVVHRFAQSYVTDPDRAAEFRDQHRNRFALYATVDTGVVDEAIKQIERQVTELGGDGVTSVQVKVSTTVLWTPDRSENATGEDR